MEIKVRLKVCMSGVQHVWKRGTELVVSPETAEAWEKAGLAERMISGQEPPKEPEPPKESEPAKEEPLREAPATATPPETADVPHGRGQRKAVK